MLITSQHPCAAICLIVIFTKVDPNKIKRVIYKSLLLIANQFFSFYILYRQLALQCSHSVHCMSPSCTQLHQHTCHHTWPV